MGALKSGGCSRKFGFRFDFGGDRYVAWINFAPHWASLCCSLSPTDREVQCKTLIEGRVSL